MNATIVTQKNGKKQRANETLLSSVAYFDAKLKNRRSQQNLPSGYPSRYYMQRQTPAQSRRIRSVKPVKVAIHADMMRITISDEQRGMQAREPGRGGGGIRGAVTGFSRASRKRMIEFMAKVRNTGSMMFLTMTYDDAGAAQNDDWHTACFEAFRRRFERQFPAWRAIWRKEHQARKSGELIGTFVPHYHLIVFTGGIYEGKALDELCEIFAAWGKEAWQEITGSTDANHLMYGFHCTPVRSRRHAYSYVAKYVAKCENNGISTGRSWGRIGQFDTSASETFVLSEDEYIELRRLVKRWLKNRSPKFARRFARSSATMGCTVFGLGDCSTEHAQETLFSGYYQFIDGAKRQALDATGGNHWTPS